MARFERKTGQQTLGTTTGRAAIRWPRWTGLAGCITVWMGGACLTLVSFSASVAQQRNQNGPEALLAQPPLNWIQPAVDNELTVIAPDGLPGIRFRERKVDARGDTTREEIETQEGTVARLVERDGRPLTAAEDADERQRLQGVLDAPSEFAKHHSHDKSQRDDALQLVRLLPKAMLYSYAPGQPQPQGAESRQIVIDFRPDPDFHPPSTRAELLTGIEGRVWIDAASHRMTRIEGHILRPVDFGYGLVARIFPGGSVELEQTNAGGDRWVYSKLREHMQVRVLLLKNLTRDSHATTWDFRLLPALPHYQDAIRMLLEMKIPLGS